jgi:hypothetical protein
MTMAFCEQTVVLPARATAFTVVCEACGELEPRAEYAGLAVHGTLRLGQDHGWATCPRGHSIRVVRKDAPAAVATAVPLATWLLL